MFLQNTLIVCVTETELLVTPYLVLRIVSCDYIAIHLNGGSPFVVIRHSFESCL
jgi:hypothetical protein